MPFRRCLIRGKTTISFSSRLSDFNENPSSIRTLHAIVSHTYSFAHAFIDETYFLILEVIFLPENTTDRFHPYPLISTCFSKTITFLVRMPVTYLKCVDLTLGIIRNNPGSH
jgi:hypothetical protein